MASTSSQIRNRWRPQEDVVFWSPKHHIQPSAVVMNESKRVAKNVDGKHVAN